MLPSRNPVDRIILGRERAVGICFQE